MLDPVFTIVVFMAAGAAVLEARSDECWPPGTIHHTRNDFPRVCLKDGRWMSTMKHQYGSPMKNRKPLDTLRTGQWTTGPNCTGQAGQMVCDDHCSTLGVCVDTGDWIPVVDCSATGQMCIAGKCEEASTECPTSLPSLAVECLVNGSFPDLTNCRRFYECSEGVAQKRSCPPGTLYDACTEKCDIGEITEECGWRVEQPCPHLGAFGSAPNNDRLYYVCTASESTMLLKWNRCPVGHFNTTSLRCADFDVSACRNGNNAGGTGPTTPATSCGTIGPQPDPNTDCKYYFCAPDGELLVVYCNAGFHFDVTEGQCVHGECTRP